MKCVHGLMGFLALIAATQSFASEISVSVHRSVFPATPADLANMAEEDFAAAAATRCGGPDRVSNVDFSAFHLVCRAYQGNVAYPTKVCTEAGYNVTGTVTCD